MGMRFRWIKLRSYAGIPVIADADADAVDAVAGDITVAVYR